MHAGRSLSCKTHPVKTKRAVPGRTRPFDDLLHEHLAAQSKLLDHQSAVVVPPCGKSVSVSRAYGAGQSVATITPQRLTDIAADDSIKYNKLVRAKRARTDILADLFATGGGTREQHRDAAKKITVIPPAATAPSLPSGATGKKKKPKRRKGDGASAAHPIPLSVCTHGARWPTLQYPPARRPAPYWDEQDRFLRCLLSYVEQETRPPSSGHDTVSPVTSGTAEYPRAPSAITIVEEHVVRASVATPGVGGGGDGGTPTPAPGADRGAEGAACASLFLPPLGLTLRSPLAPLPPALAACLARAAGGASEGARARSLASKGKAPAKPGLSTSVASVAPAAPTPVTNTLLSEFSGAVWDAGAHYLGGCGDGVPTDSAFGTFPAKRGPHTPASLLGHMGTPTMLPLAAPPLLTKAGASSVAPAKRTASTSRARKKADPSPSTPAAVSKAKSRASTDTKAKSRAGKAAAEMAMAGKTSTAAAKSGTNLAEGGSAAARGRAVYNDVVSPPKPKPKRKRKPTPAALARAQAAATAAAAVAAAGSRTGKTPNFALPAGSSIGTGTTAAAARKGGVSASAATLARQQKQKQTHKGAQHKAGTPTSGARTAPPRTYATGQIIDGQYYPARSMAPGAGLPGGVRSSASPQARGGTTPTPTSRKGGASSQAR